MKGDFQKCSDDQVALKRDYEKILTATCLGQEVMDEYFSNCVVEFLFTWSVRLVQHFFS
jgi:hypothetical protein